VSLDINRRRRIAVLAGSIFVLSAGVWLVFGPRAASDGRDARGVVGAVPPPPCL